MPLDESRSNILSPLSCFPVSIRGIYLALYNIVCCSVLDRKDNTSRETVCGLYDSNKERRGKGRLRGNKQEEQSFLCVLS